jgi:hypothetical protein
MSDHCPDCDTILEDFIEGSSMGQRCPNCGWSLVTMYTPPILEDNREYAITLLAGNDASPAVLKAISHLMGCYYITARRLVLEAPKVLFAGHASDILGWKTKLESAGVLIAITPEFPYSEDGQLLNGAVIG